VVGNAEAILLNFPIARDTPGIPGRANCEYPIGYQPMFGYKASPASTALSDSSVEGRDEPRSGCGRQVGHHEPGLVVQAGMISANLARSGGPPVAALITWRTREIVWTDRGLHVQAERFHVPDSVVIESVSGAAGMQSSCPGPRSDFSR